MGPDQTSLDGLRIDRSRRQVRRWPLWALLVFALLIVTVLGGWWLTKPRPVSVRTAVVVESASPAGERTVLNASGYVTARRQATVSSKVTGKVVEVLIEEGRKVERGEVLARLDQSNVRRRFELAKAQLAAARSGLEETRVRLAEARLNLGRTENLVAKQVSSDADLDADRAEVDSIVARLERQGEEVKVADQQLGLYRQDLEDTIIRAPFSGVVVSKDAQPGEMISPVSAGGGFTRTGICTLVDMNSLEIEVDVNEGYINRVTPGQAVRATLDAYPEWLIPAHVIAIVPAADRQKATVRVRIGFEQLDPRILPDMGIKVAFQEIADERQVDAPRMLLIPAAAMRKDAGRDVVFVVAGGRVERRAVSARSADGDRVAVSSGLAAGERVVVDPPADLAEGTAVKEVGP